ncbi:MAG: hypothetical protein ACRD2X_24870 [Vicinamibacteraceae bacterium]
MRFHARQYVDDGGRKRSYSFIQARDKDAAAMSMLRKLILEAYHAAVAAADRASDEAP